MSKKCFFCSYPNKDDAVRCINCGLELKKYWQVIDGKMSLVDERKSK